MLPLQYSVHLSMRTLQPWYYLWSKFDAMHTSPAGQKSWQSLKYTSTFNTHSVSNSSFPRVLFTPIYGHFHLDRYYHLHRHYWVPIQDLLGGSCLRSICRRDQRSRQSYVAQMDFHHKLDPLVPQTTDTTQVVKPRTEVPSWYL